MLIKNKRLSITLICSVTLITLLIILSFLYSLKYDRNITKKQHITHEDINNLKSTLLLTRNLDGGYHPIPNELGIVPDLYNTYYSLQILDLLKHPLSNKGYEEIIKWSKDTLNNQYMNKDNEDILSNLYFFIQILKQKNFKIDDIFCSNILKYLDKICDIDGTYNLATNFNEAISKDNNSLKYISNYYATEILKYINKEPKNIIYIKKWVKSMLEINLNKDISLNNCSNLLLLIKISNNINLDITNFMQKIKSQVTKYNILIEKELNKNNISIPVIYINDLLELNLYLNKDLKTLKYLQNLDNYFNTLKNENGIYSLTDQEDPNVLPTYMILKYLNLRNIEINLNPNLINGILKNRIPYSGFISPEHIESNIKDTYYAYQIDKQFNNSKNSTNIKNYLSNNFNTLFKRDEYTLCYLLPLCKQNNIKIDIKGNINKYLLKVESILKNSKELFDSDYFKIIFLLDTIEHLTEGKNSTINNSLFTLKQKIRNTKSHDRFLQKCIELKISSLLNDKNDETYNLEYIIKNLNDNLKGTDYKLKLIYIYNAFKILNDYNCFTKIDKNSILKTVYGNKTAVSLFSYNNESPVSWESTYYSIYIISKLN
ncbi:hypothetical protein C3495_14540 (plasmid) [Clostridiaceae bacterium 14S0207]|nr:hypothetical protein C3495_14540 [Clostridiaceae bacterium 14S0207]